MSGINQLLSAYIKKQNGALSLGLTSGQIRLDEQSPSSNSALKNNLFSKSENVNDELFFYWVGGFEN